MESKGDINKRFLGTIDNKTKNEILLLIADHYCVSTDEIYKEITSSHAENIIEYMTDPYRSQIYSLMQNHGF